MIIDRRASGFTLMELIMVLAMLGIIAAITIPIVKGYREQAEEKVCESNRRTVERTYNTFVFGKDIEDELVFDQFLAENYKEICPTDGVIIYKNGRVICSKHIDTDESNGGESSEEQVPWL